MSILPTPQGSQEIAKVVLEVDNKIIEHFSRNLYDSPYKAIEELVINGFDAFAEHVHVYTPGPYTTDRVLVWDDGDSMDVDGLKRLWWIAKSPKTDGQRVISRGAKKRNVIGKFGIGKLASYSVGKQISHLCKYNDRYFLVTIDYRKIDPNSTDGHTAISPSSPLEEPVYELSKDAAYEFVSSLFDSPPESLDGLFNASTWTLAIVDDLRKPDLPIGRLKWILGNGMPLRPDFIVSVNEGMVTSKLLKHAEVKWDLGAPEVRLAVKDHWSGLAGPSALEDFEVGDEEGLDPTRPDTRVPFIRFRQLGKVWGYIQLFDESLLKYRSADSGRSHGFFLMVRGRLVNPDDDKLYFREPSYQTFYRSQFVIHADELDADLLADRQRLRQDARSVVELREFQRAIMRITRATVEQRDQEQADEESTQSRLPVASRLYYKSPINALLYRQKLDPQTQFDFAATVVHRKPLGRHKHISEWSTAETAFLVNIEHPYYDVIRRTAGESKAGKELLRTLDLLGVSERLLEGYLYDSGLSSDRVKDVLEWRDGLFRELAKTYASSSDVLAEMERTSHIGGEGFEKALQNVFEDMGFRAKRDGASGSKDVFVSATVGLESYNFTPPYS